MNCLYISQKTKDRHNVCEMGAEFEGNKDKNAIY